MVSNKLKKKKCTLKVKFATWFKSTLNRAVLEALSKYSSFYKPIIATNKVEARCWFSSSVIADSAFRAMLPFPPDDKCEFGLTDLQ